jgi:hypothetical protein
MALLNSAVSTGCRRLAAGVSWLNFAISTGCRCFVAKFRHFNWLRVFCGMWR